MLGHLAVLAATTVAIGGYSFTDNVPDGAPTDAGSVTVIAEGPRREALVEGGSATVFGLLLPAGAACPGDSANDQWRVQTFIVPVSADIAALTYDENGPLGRDQYALYGVDTNPIASALTAPNLEPGEPGLITGLPWMTFEEFPPGTLPDGRYSIGVACTYFREVTASYWHTQIDVASTPDDEPGQMTWRVTDASLDTVEAPIAGETNNTGTWILAVSGASAVAIALLVLRQRGNRRVPEGKSS